MPKKKKRKIKAAAVSSSSADSMNFDRDDVPSAVVEAPDIALVRGITRSSSSGIIDLTSSVATRPVKPRRTKGVLSDPDDDKGEESLSNDEVDFAQASASSSSQASMSSQVSPSSSTALSQSAGEWATVSAGAFEFSQSQTSAADAPPTKRRRIKKEKVLSTQRTQPLAAGSLTCIFI